MQEVNAFYLQTSFSLSEVTEAQNVFLYRSCNLELKECVQFSSRTHLNMHVNSCHLQTSSSLNGGGGGKESTCKIAMNYQF